MATTSPTVVNGVNIDQLIETVEAVKANPSLARFRFRATTEWINGGHSRTSIQGVLRCRARRRLAHAAVHP
ncbi:MAG: hypothetical protein KatS3mg059_0988 [Thermomicrobiales bacterium]|nr:MAG: hypothetical protein KatS3mg059_0988 [Thermomicrobiales bacterium]